MSRGATKMPEREHLHRQAMGMAFQAAIESPDPSTQNGASVLLPDGQVMISDCNRFPNGVAYSAERWERPLKYALIEHAERNAIFGAVRQGIATEGATLVSPWAACADCARAIVQAGFATLVRLSNSKTHWVKERAVGDVILQEGGIEVIELDPTTLEIPDIRRNGEIWHP